tara:strand:- start:963 stop:1217 length:255 start_codon:yes stop_codon:yes gene_type:complete
MNLEVGQVVCVFTEGDLVTMVIREVDEKAQTIKGLYKQEYSFDQIVHHMTKSSIEYLFHIYHREYSGHYADHQSFIKVDPIPRK